MKKIRNLIASVIVFVLAVGFNVVPAEAYTDLATPVTISATGELVGTVEAFTVGIVKQSDGSPDSLAFETPSGVYDSEEALQIKGGTDEVNARIIIYTDNDSNSGVHEKPTVDPATGIDGSGLVGQTNPGFSVPLIWGTKSAADNDPNTRENYTLFTAANLDGGVNAVYIVDTRHTHSFTTVGSALDNGPVFDSAGVAVVNTTGDGLYPQRWDETLYKEAAKTNVFAEPLYSTIATVAFGLGNDGTDYICNVPKLTTSDSTDNVAAKLGVGGTDGLYIYIGGDFRAKPAQVYSTGQLILAVVQD